MNIRNFNRNQIKEIAEKYANELVSRSYFTEKYNISDKTFYSILKKAVVEHIVTEDTAYAMRVRAITNSRSKLEDETIGARSHFHYDDLLEKRKNFLFCKSTRVRILKEFSERDLRESKADFCKSHVFTEKFLGKILIFSIVHNELTKKVYSKIKENSLASISNTDAVYKFFDLLDELKEEVKSGKRYGINELYNKVYYSFHPKKVTATNTSKETKPKKVSTDEEGNIVDDGYSIIDEND